MRTQAATALYALLALACLGSTLCGLITEIGKPLQQAGNVVNELGSKIPNTANIDSALSSVNTVKDAAKEVVDKITDLNPIENIIGIPSEISFLYKLISILKKLLSSVKLNVNAEHDQDKASTTVAVESTETTEVGPQDDQSSTVVPTEISNDSETTESASEDPVNNSSEILTESVDESATADPVDISK